MKIGIVVNIMPTAQAGQTTYRLAAECASAGHEVWIMSTGTFAYDADECVRAHARAAPPGSYESSEDYLDGIRSDDAQHRWVTVDDLDVLFLRSNPSVQSLWAQMAGISFGRLAMRHGVVVVNDPNGLAKAHNRMYLQTFPQEVRPKTLISRSTDRIKAWACEVGTIVIKPVLDSSGRNVFVVTERDLPQVDEMIKSVSRNGYVIAQEYLPAAAEGNTRLFLMNGVPLMADGRYAAYRRVRIGDDPKTTSHKLLRAKVDETMLTLADMVRPRLVEDGMFLVALDIVGDKLMEVNVFSPGGLGTARKFEKANFARAVVNALERKVDYMKYYRRNFSNVEMATL